MDATLIFEFPGEKNAQILISTIWTEVIFTSSYAVIIWSDKSYA